MNGPDRLLKIFAEEVITDLSFYDVAINYLNKKIPKYTRSKYIGGQEGGNYIMSEQNGKLIRSHRIEYEDYWQTRLADFLENEILLQKLNIILDE